MSISLSMSYQSIPTLLRRQAMRYILYAIKYLNKRNFDVFVIYMLTHTRLVLLKYKPKIGFVFISHINWIWINNWLISCFSFFFPLPSLFSLWLYFYFLLFVQNKCSYVDSHKTKVVICYPWNPNDCQIFS